MTATTTYYHTTVAQPPVVPFYQITTQQIGSRTYRYGQCHGGYFIREAKTGARMDFGSITAMCWVLDRIEDEAAKAESAPTLSELVTIAAITTPTTEHVIRMDTLPVADITFCESCGEVVKGDSVLCPACETTSVEIIAPTSAEISEKGVSATPAERLHALNNDLKAMFVDISTNEAWKAKRAKLLAEKKELEAQIEAAHIGYGTSSHVYHNTSIDVALVDFERRYGCKPNQMRISKYDTAPAIEGIEIARAGSLLPGSIWLGHREGTAKPSINALIMDEYHRIEVKQQAEAKATDDTPKEGVIKIEEDKPKAKKISNAQRKLLETLSEDGYFLKRSLASGTWGLFNDASYGLRHIAHIEARTANSLMDRGLIAERLETYREPMRPKYDITDAGRKAVSS